MKPEFIGGCFVIKGYKEGTYTERAHFLLKFEKGQLALAKVEACDRATQSNALECDRLENEDIYVRNYAKRDFEPLDKLDKIQVYGPAYALGNYVAANKNFIQLPATAVIMTDTGYSSTTRFTTTFPFRLTICDNKLTCEYSISQVAKYTQAIGRSFAAGAIQMMIVCIIVFNAVAHCRTNSVTVARESRVFRFRNFITTGIIARRLGTYKIVSVQLCIYHALNVQTYFAAVNNSTETVMDTLAFASEGVLLVVIFAMQLDQLLFGGRFSSVRETFTVLGSSGMYFLALHLSRGFFLWREQVQVTELARCARANACYIIHGLQSYYAGLCVSLLVPVVVVNGPIHRYIIPTRAARAKALVPSEKLTSFEKFCVGTDARMEFGDFERDDLGTPISIVHAMGFTYVGSYLVRVKDYYIVVLARYAPESFVKSSGLTMTIFRLDQGKIEPGRHVLLGAAYKLFRGDHRESPYHAIQ